MKLNIKSLSITTAIMAGGLMLILCAWNSITIDFGKGAILLFEELHPAGSISLIHSITISDKIIASLVNILWSAIDGAIFGFLYAAIYNFILIKFVKKVKEVK